jgi:tRNA dimethylallyltransferase
MNPLKKPIVFIMGPTATGKTDAVAALYDRFPISIISVDSSLVYRGMDIGTAKPNSEFLASYPHHLVNIREATQTYSAAEFHTDAVHLVQQAHQQGRVPVLVGGTFFYFNALEQGLDELPAAQVGLRQLLQVEADNIGWPALHARLVKLDKESAQRIQENDAQRIQRALEIVITTGKPINRRKRRSEALSDCEIIKIGLSFSDRLELHERVKLRYKLMLKKGLVEEVETLLKAGVPAEASAMRMIGYRQTLEFLQGDITLQESEEKGIAATRQLAKRQLTWMRNQSNLIWWVDEGLRDKKFDKLGNLFEQYLR